MRDLAAGPRTVRPFPWFTTCLLPWGQISHRSTALAPLPVTLDGLKILPWLLCHRCNGAGIYYRPHARVVLASGPPD